MIQLKIAENLSSRSGGRKMKKIVMAGAIIIVAVIAAAAGFLFWESGHVEESQPTESPAVGSYPGYIVQFHYSAESGKVEIVKVTPQDIGLIIPGTAKQDDKSWTFGVQGIGELPDPNS